MTPWTKGLRNIYGQRGLRANAVALGWIDTGMSTAASAAASSLTPLDRNGRPGPDAWDKRKT